MACPYFYPVERQARDCDPRSAMLPLGDVWTGLCQAVPGAAHPPDSAALYPLCALGYARGRCTHFPAEAPGADAVRFTIVRDDGATVMLHYVLERDHHPFAHGPLEYSMVGRELAAAPAPAPLHRQAEAYVQSYLRRKNPA